jgi:hypothetical protein
LFHSASGRAKPPLMSVEVGLIHMSIVLPLVPAFPMSIPGDAGTLMFEVWTPPNWKA